MLEINLRQLEAFVATAEHHSFTKAADAMYLTQSTISSHINMLERALGVRLIQRGARQRVALTEDGERVYREAKNILRQCQALQDTAGQCGDNRLTIAASTVPGRCVLPTWIAMFLAQHPVCKYTQLPGDNDQILRDLQHGKCNIGFVCMARDPQAYHSHVVAEDRLVLIAANKEPYRALWEKGVSAEELLKRPMILGTDAADVCQSLEKCGFCADNLSVVAQLDDPEAIRFTVERGVGVSVVSMLSARKDVEEGKLLSFDLEADRARQKIYMIWRKDCQLSGLEEKFVRFVQGRG